MVLYHGGGGDMQLLWGEARIVRCELDHLGERGGAKNRVVWMPEGLGRFPVGGSLGARLGALAAGPA